MPSILAQLSIYFVLLLRFVSFLVHRINVGLRQAVRYLVLYFCGQQFVSYTFHALTSFIIADKIVCRNVLNEFVFFATIIIIVASFCDAKCSLCPTLQLSRAGQLGNTIRYSQLFRFSLISFD